MTGGERGGVSIELNGDLTLLVLKGEEQGIQLTPDLPSSIEAPVRQGDEVGSVDVVLDGKTVASIPVVASESIDSKGFVHNLRRIWRSWPFTV